MRVKAVLESLGIRKAFVRKKNSAHRLKSIGFVGGKNNEQTRSCIF